MTGTEKTKFRSTKRWKTFRETLIKKRGHSCELCGSIKPSKQLDVHHLRPDEYDNLDETKFKILCTSCHGFVEEMVLKIGHIPNKEKFLEWCGDFLPRIERKYVMDIR